MCWFFNLYRYVMPLSSDRKNNDFQLYNNFFAVFL